MTSEQIPTRPVSTQEIMSTAAFARSLEEMRKGIVSDSRVDDDDWNYARPSIRTHRAAEYAAENRRQAESGGYRPVRCGFESEAHCMTRANVFPAIPRTHKCLLTFCR
jgi:hypothetical protein